MNTQIRYSFCETISAQALAPWHIRELTALGMKLGGGADTDALCGVPVAWDLKVPISAHHLSHCCRKCSGIFLLAQGTLDLDLNINTMHWTYGIIRPGKELDMVVSIGPLTPGRIRKILGGDYELVKIMRGEVLAARVDRAELEPNNYYQDNINGPVVLGKMDGEVFVGLLD